MLCLIGRNTQCAHTKSVNCYFKCLFKDCRCEAKIFKYYLISSCQALTNSYFVTKLALFHHCMIFYHLEEIIVHYNLDHKVEIN